MLFFGRVVVEADINNLESTSEKCHFVRQWLMPVLHALQSCKPAVQMPGESNPDAGRVLSSVSELPLPPSCICIFVW